MLARLLGDGAPRVLFLHGPAGSGKSSLLRRFARDRSGEAGIIILDCRQVEPTEHGFLAALAAHPSASLTVDLTRGKEHISWSLSKRTVLCLDQYETARLLDTWLRQSQVPNLPSQVSLILSGRDEPHTVWRRLPPGSFEAMHLGPLAPQDGRRLVTETGASPERADAITHVVGGHPLALLMGSMALPEESERPSRDATMSQLLDELTRAYLADLDLSTLHLLEAAAVVRWVTTSLLGSMLPGVDSVEATQTLGELPFMESIDGHLALPEPLRPAILARLRETKPSTALYLRRRAWDYLRSRAAREAGATPWSDAADMIYLLENSTVRGAFLPTDMHRFAIEPADPIDGAAIDEILDRHDSAESAELLRSWWYRHPEAFRVARGWGGEVVGFSVVLPAARLDLDRFSYDPVVAAWASHLRDHPVPHGQEVLFFRRWLTQESGGRPGDVQAALWGDLQRSLLELRPRLRRLYLSTDHPDDYTELIGGMSGSSIPTGEVEMGGGPPFQSLVVDFGPASVAGWLVKLVGEELGVEEDDLIDVIQRQVVLGAGRVDLTPREFEVMSYLRSHTGEVVSRQELLKDVWGADSRLAPSAVDGVIYTLRKKLGPKAKLIETVRGVGYRLSED